MTDIFKPLLAGKFDPKIQRFPALASVKLDGVRALAMSGLPKSRSMKDIPNRHIQALFREHADVLEGLDGEFIIGPPNAEDVYRRTVSVVMSDDKPINLSGLGDDKFTFQVFDLWNVSAPYADRLAMLQKRLFDARFRALAWVQPVDHIKIDGQDQLDAFEAQALGDGYEGVMLRDPAGPYKQGRSSTREGTLLKVKRYEDFEAEVIGTEEEMHNTNEAQKNELGRTKRSGAQAGLVGKGTMGALICRGINGPFKGVEFNIGTGFTAAMRAGEWPSGTIVTYKTFMVGVKDKPRHPVFKGRRDARDMSEAA